MNVKDLGDRPASKAIRELISRMVYGRPGARPVAVQRRAIPYWQQQGWRTDGKHYEGSYQTPFGAFLGRIQQRSSMEIDFFLYQPSQPIRDCGHWACFQHQGNDWYAVHMAKRPGDVSSGIIAIERLIVEAYESN